LSNISAHQLRKALLSKIRGKKTLYQKIYSFISVKYDYVYSIIMNFNNYLKCRLVKKYKHHVIYLDLKPGWCDVDERMVYANFKLLEHFIEQECSQYETIDDYDDLSLSERGIIGLHESYEHEDHRYMSNCKELITLYKWWKYERPELKKKMDDMYEYVKKIKPKNFDKDRVSIMIAQKTNSLLEENVAKYIEEYKNYRNFCHETDEYISSMDDIMLQRLIVKRHILWS